MFKSLSYPLLVLIYLRICNWIVLFRVSLDLCGFRSFKCIYECQAWTACLTSFVDSWRIVSITHLTGPCWHLHCNITSRSLSLVNQYNSMLRQNESKANYLSTIRSPVPFTSTERRSKLNFPNVRCTYQTEQTHQSRIRFENFRVLVLVSGMKQSDLSDASASQICMPRHLVCWCHGLWFQDNTPS